MSPNSVAHLPYPGLRPYMESEKDLFFGRNRQTDDLLGLLQKHKCITLLGPAGSGKTSLIQAGLIPALFSGHHGIAGKEWAICKTRPGLSPIKNLAIALSTCVALNPSVRPASDAALRLENKLRSGNTGLMDAYLNAEVAHKKNLLIIIDQLEDIFLYFDATADIQTGELDLYFNNIARAARADEAAVYFLLSMRSEQFGEIAAHRRIQELINESQYLVPRLRSNDVKEIASGPLQKAGLSIHSLALDQLQKSMGNDLRKLPQLQFALYTATKEIKRNNPTNPEIQPADLARIGGLDDCFSSDLEQRYQSFPEPQQQKVANLFRVISRRFGQDEKPEIISFASLCQICRLAPDEAATLLQPFLTEPGIYLSQIYPDYHPNPTQPHSTIQPNSRVYVHNEHLLAGWTRLHDWMVQEKDSREIYKRLVADANRFNAGKAGYLRPPDLDMALNWKTVQSPSPEWASQYAPFHEFDHAIGYLEESETAYNNEVQAKELRRKRELQNLRKLLLIIVISGMVVTSVILGLLYDAKRLQYIAENARQEELQSKEKLKNTNQNLNNTLQELQLTTQELTEKNQDLKKSNDERTRQQQELQVKATKIENQQKSIQTQMDALKQSNNRLAEEKIAVEQAKTAESEAKQQARDREKLASLEKQFFVLENDYLAQEENTLPTTKELIQTYRLYKEYSQKVHQQILPNDALQRTLNLGFAMLEHKQTYSESSNKLLTTNGSLRTIAVSPGGHWATGGDNGYVFFQKQNKSSKIFIGDRIRALYFSSENELIAGTFNGKIWKISTASSSKSLLYSYSGKDGNNLIDILPSNKSNEILAVGINDIICLNYSTGITELIPLPGKTTATCQVTSDNTLFLGGTAGFFKFKRGDKLQPLFPSQSAEQTTYLPSALATNGQQIAIGTKSGKIWIFNIHSFSPASSPLFNFNEHQAGITHLHYDPSNNRLFSASLDNKVKIFDFQLKSDFADHIITLNDQKKWVWALVPFTSASGTDFLLTSDEGGNLIQWFINTEQQIHQLEQKMKSY